MTRKDYQAFASMFKRYRIDAPEHDDDSVDAAIFHQWYLLVAQTADIFALDNPRFNRARFYTACGIEGYK